MRGTGARPLLPPRGRQGQAQALLPSKGPAPQKLSQHKAPGRHYRSELGEETERAGSLRKGPLSVTVAVS